MGPSHSTRSIWVAAGQGQGTEQPQEDSVGPSLEQGAGTATPQVLLQLCWQQVTAPKLLWMITSCVFMASNQQL